MLKLDQPEDLALIRMVRDAMIHEVASQDDHKPVDMERLAVVAIETLIRWSVDHSIKAH